VWRPGGTDGQTDGQDVRTCFRVSSPLTSADDVLERWADKTNCVLEMTASGRSSSSSRRTDALDSQSTAGGLMSAGTSQRCRVLLRKSYTIFTRVLCSFILLPPPPPPGSHVGTTRATCGWCEWGWLGSAPVSHYAATEKMQPISYTYCNNYFAPGRRGELL